VTRADHLHDMPPAVKGALDRFNRKLAEAKVKKDIMLCRGDCLEVMKQLEPASVDMVLTDPPYGTTACKWDSIIPLEPMWEQLKRITKPNAAIVLMAAQPFTSALVMSNTKMFKYCWVWNKKKGGNIQVLKWQPCQVLPSKNATERAHRKNLLSRRSWWDKALW